MYSSENLLELSPEVATFESEWFELTLSEQFDEGASVKPRRRNWHWSSCPSQAKTNWTNSSANSSKAPGEAPRRLDRSPKMWPAPWEGF